jgi:glycosyltransferase involved in cell wall biosynthesis
VTAAGRPSGDSTPQVTPMERFDYFATGPRGGFQTPIALEGADLLESAHFDVWLPPGTIATVAQRIVGDRSASRVISEIPVNKLHAHPQLFAIARVRRWLILTGRDTRTIDSLLIRTFRSIAQRCKSPAVFGLQSSSVELFTGRKCRIMEQFSPPARAERCIADEERQRFEGWAPDRVSRVTSWDYRMEREWAAADVVWVPSLHLTQLCQQFGADPAKFRVIPYPIPHHPGVSWVRRPREGGRLRVVFAGTLMLEKGVQYIYEALRRWTAGLIDMHFFGPVQLTSLGTSRLSNVGTVHGPVSRARLLDEFTRADLLLFPSLSEGSALVAAEAAGIGLPIIATEESGAPESARLVEARSADEIRAALEEVLDEPPTLERLSQNCLEEARQRNVDAFEMALAGLARETLNSSFGDARQ